MQILDGCVADVVEIVGQYLGRKAHGNAFSALCQQQGELGGQRDGLLVAAVVAQLPFGGLGVESHVEGEFRQSGLNISGCSGTVAGKDVTPVALCIDQQVLLSHLHQRVAD